MRNNCEECGAALVSAYGWWGLPASTRNAYRSQGVRPHGGHGLCDVHHRRKWLGSQGGKRFSNDEMYELFWEHDPGPHLPKRERFAVVAGKIGRSPRTVERAARVGGWGLVREVSARKPEMVLYRDAKGNERWVKPETTAQS